MHEAETMKSKNTVDFIEVSLRVEFAAFDAIEIKYMALNAM